jgi:hypothetical protein
MATDAENLAIIKTQIIARIAEVTAEKKPSYSIDGQSVSWTEYAAMLWKQLAEVDKQIQANGADCLGVQSFGF